MLTRRDFLTATAATAVATILPTVSGPAPLPDFGAFTDLAGTIPAKPGDRIAFVNQHGIALTQPVASNRPILRDGHVEFSEGESLEIHDWNPDDGQLVCDFTKLGYA